LSHLFVNGQELPVVSKEALLMYRQQHQLVITAYQNYLQEQY
jgi:hypothetical protein